MKKLLVLVAAATLFATPALAIISGGPHDMSSNVAGGGLTSDTDETCVFCHTPHGATASSFAPLWNRTNVAATNFYGNPAGTMDAVTTLAGVNGSDATLCLSCHDGSSYAAALTNPPNALAGQPVVAGTMAATANLDTDLSNDHPIGFVYQDSITNGDTELVGAPAGITFYGTLSDTMWCSSCHDVHGGVANTPLLVKSNVASALCTSCHVK